jgi:hypothetical protein
MGVFTFRRPALNRSYSNRTAKVGRPFHGALRDAVRRATEHSTTEGQITVYDTDDTPVAQIRRYRNHGSDKVWLSLHLLDTHANTFFGDE